MEPFDANKVVLELIELAQTPDQVAWLKTVSPEVTQDMIRGLRDVAKEAEAEARKFREDAARMSQKYSQYMSMEQVVAIVKALRPDSKGCDC